MNYLGLGVVGRAGARLYSSCKDLYNDLNGANLTGAVDIVVVKQLDGTYKSTPFHVRFGKFGVLRTGDLQKEVEVEVNGEPVSNKMMLDESGMAFFVKPKHSVSVDVLSDSSRDAIYESRSSSLSSIPDPLFRVSELDLETSIFKETSIGTSFVPEEPETTPTSVDLDTTPTSIVPETTPTSTDLEATPTVTENAPIPADFDTTLTSTLSETTPTLTVSGTTPTKVERLETIARRYVRNNFKDGDMAIVATIDGTTHSTINKEQSLLTLPTKGYDLPDGVTNSDGMNDGVTGDSGVIGDCSTTGDSGVIGDCSATGDSGGVISDGSVISDGVLSDNCVTSDGGAEDSDSGEKVEQDNETTGISEGNGNKVFLKLYSEYDHNDTGTLPDKQPFLTPTDDPNEFKWALGGEKPIPETVITMEAPPPTDLTSELDSGVLSDSAVELHSNKEKYCLINEAHSDSELDNRNESKTGGEATPLTRTDVNSIRNQPISDNASRYSLWGALAGIWSRSRPKKRRFSSIEDGVYLDELDNGRMRDEEKAQYLPSSSPPEMDWKMNSSKANSQSSAVEYPSDSSGVDSSSPLLSPVRGLDLEQDISEIVAMLSNVAISQCGWASPITEEVFVRSQVSFDEFCNNWSLLTSNNTVIRLGGKYYNWLVAGPMIMSALLYQKQLPKKCQNDLEQRHMLKTKSKQSLWSKWSSESVEAKYGRQEDDNVDNSQHHSTNTGDTSISTQPPPPAPPPSDLKPSQSLPPPTRLINDDIMSSDEEMEKERSSLSRVRQRSLRRKRLVFTNELTTEELSSWPLRPGKNELVFSITTKYQGTAKASCSLYLWNHNEKIVVSDFDGTITRSDVAGQVLPFLGKDWTHFGVIELFNAIQNNGYKLLYLSARAIGQSTYTKNYLRNTRSRNVSLPDGPLLVTPFSLYKAFKKEVIERKPEEFKIVCLQQIRDFFPDNYNPFHAGFGNKPSDAKSYLKVEIPPSRIFTVNPKGEIRNELTWTFQSSYIGLFEFTDAQFPPLSKGRSRNSNSTGTAIEGVDPTHTPMEGNDEDPMTVASVSLPDDNYSSFIYWKHSFNAFDSFDLP